MTENSPTFDDARFDRLVDGELAPEEYRRLLATLDDEPGGWRRCALAFLEAQSLGQDLSALRREVDTKSRPAEPLVARRDHDAWLRPLALAALLVFAVGLGHGLRGFPLPGSPSAANRHEDAPQNIAAASPGPQEPSAQANPVGSVTLVVDGDNGARGEQIRLPVFDERDARGRESLEQSALPAEVRGALERMGHVVEQRQEYVPFALQDGRQVVFPVEQLRIVPAVRRSY